MPTIDGGHIFFTGLYPVRLGGARLAGGSFVPHSHRLREELALLPTAQQNPETVAAGLVSPFARCRRTHFLRLVVIDQPMWNGRDPSDPLLNVARSLLGRPVNLRAQPPFDVLSRPWLLLAADIDRAPGAPDEGLASWAEALWARSEAEMRAVFRHCEGFEAVADAAGFARYLKRGQLETTMSFNGYYDGTPPLRGASLAGLLALPLLSGAGLVLLARLLLGPLGVAGWLLLVVVGLAAALILGLRRLDSAGARPFPQFPDSDLATILKALFLQERFTRFATDHQLDDPQALHRAFAGFLAETRPSDLAPEVSQAPGVVRSDAGALPLPVREPVARARP
ncbi:hypothetical protein [Thermaurantiacus sp.]